VDFPAAAELLGKIVDAVGVPAIVLGTVVATWSAVGRRRRGEPSYQPYRLRIGRSILLGLEFLAGPLPLRIVHDGARPGALADHRRRSTCARTRSPDHRGARARPLSLSGTSCIEAAPKQVGGVYEPPRL